MSVLAALLVGSGQVLRPIVQCLVYCCEELIEGVIVIDKWHGEGTEVCR